jgi:HAD superfamily hydrolase (TIGR01509 family)
MHMRAIVFDLDGTLLDTRERIFWQFEMLTKEFDGAPATRREIAAAMHGTTDEVISALIKNEDVSFARLQQRYQELREESLAHLRTYDGAKELLPILRRIGVQLAAVTSGDEHELRALDQVGIRQHFGIVIHSGHVTNPRPHPEGIELALRHLGVKPEYAAFVGDMPSDIVAGKRAGLAKTIAITHGFSSTDALVKEAPTHLIEDIPSILDVMDARVEL